MEPPRIPGRFNLALGQNMELLGMTSIYPDPMLWDGGVLPSYE
jgi:hypothetical protein